MSSAVFDIDQSRNPRGGWFTRETSLLFQLVERGRGSGFFRFDPFVGCILYPSRQIGLKKFGAEEDERQSSKGLVSMAIGEVM